MKRVTLTEDETLDAALAGAALTRFGDGELRLAVGQAAASQQPHPRLRSELVQILRGPSKALVCIPNPRTPRPHWEFYRRSQFASLMGEQRYGSAFVTRPDSAPWIDRPDYWEKVRALWKDKDVALVAGDARKSLRVEDFWQARSLRVIEAPPKNAYAEVDRIERDVRDHVGPVIMCLGACATVLAHRLAGRPGLHALDLGHIGMFMRHAGCYRYDPANLCSPRYRSQLKEMHARDRVWGADGKMHAGTVMNFAREIGARTILDYGCGAGTLKKKLPSEEFNVREYDPGVIGKDAPPKDAQLVVATDVLEHVEPDKINAVIDHIVSIARKGVYLKIALRKANEVLDDKRNAHLLVKPAEWWVAKLHERISVQTNVEVKATKKELLAWIRQ